MWIRIRIHNTVYDYAYLGGAGGAPVLSDPGEGGFGDVQDVPDQQQAVVHYHTQFNFTKQGSEETMQCCGSGCDFYSDPDTTEFNLKKNGFILKFTYYSFPFFKTFYSEFVLFKFRLFCFQLLFFYLHYYVLYSEYRYFGYILKTLFFKNNGIYLI